MRNLHNLELVFIPEIVIDALDIAVIHAKLIPMKHRTWFTKEDPKSHRGMSAVILIAIDAELVVGVFLLKFPQYRSHLIRLSEFLLHYS